MTSMMAEWPSNISLKRCSLSMSNASVCRCNAAKCSVSKANDTSVPISFRRLISSSSVNISMSDEKRLSKATIASPCRMGTEAAEWKPLAMAMARHCCMAGSDWMFLQATTFPVSTTVPMISLLKGASFILIDAKGRETATSPYSEAGVTTPLAGSSTPIQASPNLPDSTATRQMEGNNRSLSLTRTRVSLICDRVAYNLLRCSILNSFCLRRVISRVTLAKPVNW